MLILSFFFVCCRFNIAKGKLLINRRNLLKSVFYCRLFSAVRVDVPAHLWQEYEFMSGPAVRDRLNQGPFDVKSGRRLA